MFTLLGWPQNMNYVDETSKILESLESPFNVIDFKDNIFESVKWLCSFYDENSTKIDDFQTQQIKEVLSYLPHVCNKKELLLALLGELNCFNGHDKYLALIGPIHKCLQLIPVNFTSIVQAYTILCSHLESVPISEASLECVETLKEDEKYSETRVVMKVFLDRFSFFVDELHSKMKQKRHVFPAMKKAVGEFSLILLRVFNRPLGFLRLNCEPDSCELLCLNLFERLQTNAINYTLQALDFKEKNERRLIKNDYKPEEEDLDCDDDDDEIYKFDIEMGCGILCCLIFNAKYSGSLVPQVYSKPYLLEVLAPVINKLLDNEYNNMHLVHKGCSLMLNILWGIGKTGFQPRAFDNKFLKYLVKSLVGLMDHCLVKEVILMCFQCMNALLWALHPSDRLAYLGTIIRGTKSPSIKGFGITALKNQLQEEGPDSFDPKLLNSSLLHIFSMELPKPNKVGPFSSIIDHMDRLMPTINFLIYLVIRDKSKLKEFSLSPVIRFAMANFLGPLKREVENFKTQCLSEMEVIMRDDGGPEETGNLLANVTIGNSSKNALTMKDKENVLKRLLIDADLMASSVERVESLVGKPDQEVDAPKAPPNTVAPSSVFEPIMARSFTNSRLPPFKKN